MSIEAFYEVIDGDLPGVRGRLLTDERIAKFIGIFAEDPTYATLVTAMDDGDAPEAFRAAHTMKGLASNLGFTHLLDSSSALTEALRPGDDGSQPSTDAAAELMGQVVQDYQQIAAAAKLVG